MDTARHRRRKWPLGHRIRVGAFWRPAFAWWPYVAYS
jgi:hypothetical protein